MTFLLQTQKLFMSNAWNLTELLRGHDSGLYRLFFVLGKNTQIVSKEEDFWKVPVLDINPFFFLEDKINELFYWDKVNSFNLCISVYSSRDKMEQTDFF